MANIQPLKILFLHPTYSFGGAERTAKNLFSRLNPEKFNVILVSSREIAPKISGPVVVEIIYIEDIGMDVWFADIRRLIKDVRVVIKLIKKFKPDMVFAMMHFSSVLVSLAKLFAGHRCMYVSSPRGPSSDYLRSCYPDWRQRFYLKTLFSIFCRLSDCLIVPSNGTKYDCVKHYGAKDEKVFVIYNSVDIENILRLYNDRVEMEIEKDSFVIASVGRLTMEKKLPLLINAIAIVKRSHKVKLIIIGDGNERDRLKALSEEKGVSNDVVFLGFQDNPYKFFRMADIYVHTCLVEGFGNVIIEAMTCGLPVIATDCPYGPREILQDGEFGILVPMDNQQALADAIIKLIVDYDLKKELSGRSQQRAKDFSIQKMVMSYERIFSLTK